MTFLPIIGGRGIGKTYSALQYLIEHQIHFLYLRSTQIEIDMCMTAEGNPFKSLNRDLGYKYEIIKGKIPKIIKVITEKEYEIYGYGAALSTWTNVKSADFTDITVILWEEFIIPPEKRRFLKNEVDAFFNLYETVNRNRELMGIEPVKVIMLSNAVSLNSPMLDAMGAISTIEKMIVQKRRVATIKEKSLRIELILDNEISENKKETVLYRLASGTRYYEQAINNAFAYDSRYNVLKKNISEYYPVCSYGDIYIYRHKSDATLYASSIYADCPRYNDATRALFKRNHWLELREKLISGKMFFETFTIKCKIEEIL